MELAKYEEVVMKHSVMYPNHGANYVYPALKLAGEAGEAADKIGKWWRNHDVMSWRDLQVVAVNHPEIRRTLLRELGDVLWYITALAREFDSSLEEVAVLNIEKIDDRVARGTIKSEGDDR